MPAIDPAAARHATEALPGIPRDEGGPVFREPWEAQAFSMALALHERGVFTWPEWAATLADEITRAQAVAFARDVLRDNAAKLYRFDASAPVP